MMRYDYTHIRMTKIQTVTTSNADQYVEKLDHSHFAGGNLIWDSHSG